MDKNPSLSWQESATADISKLESEDESQELISWTAEGKQKINIRNGE